jgi:predicted dehydrogenase
MTIRVGFVGAGGQARVHMRAVQQFPGAAVAAVCDISQRRAEEAAHLFGGRLFPDYRAMLDAEAVDAMVIAVPPAHHGTMEEEAAVRGVHLLVEKPLALSMAEVRGKWEAIRRAGIITATGYCLRYHPPADTLHGWLAGEVPSLLVGMYLTSVPNLPWWPSLAESGGQIVEQATHAVDLLRYFAGEVQQVTALYAGGSLRTEIPRFDIWESSTVSLAFASGSVGAVIATCALPPGTGGTSFSLHARKGMLEMQGNEARLHDGRRTLTEKGAGDMYALQDHAWLTAIATGDRGLIRSDYRDAARTLAVTLAANESAGLGGAPVTPEAIV